MTEIDTKLTRNFTKDLSVLYVEDDHIIQKQTHKFLRLLFKSVDIANDGQEAFEMFENRDFDIVITDIMMPNMDGLELSKKIRELNQYQNIIVTSAYNDSEQLIEFINLHVRQFMLKPVEINNMLFTLYTVSKAIVNNKMIEQYRIKLEKNNQELREKNQELQNIVKILDTKLFQLTNNNLTTNITLKNISKEHLEELEELEYDIKGSITLINLSKNITNINIQVLSGLFSSYTHILSAYAEYKTLADGINSLIYILDNRVENFIQNIQNTSILLESFIYVLKMWRDNLKKGDVRKAFKLHTSMINDINTIIAIIDGKENDIKSDIELF